MEKNKIKLQHEAPYDSPTEKEKKQLLQICVRKKKMKILSSGLSLLNLDCCVVSVSKAGTVGDCFWPSVVSCRTLIHARRVRGRIRWLGGQGGWTKSQGQAFGQEGAPFHSWWAAGCHLRTCCSGCNRFPSVEKPKGRHGLIKLSGRNGFKQVRRRMILPKIP